MRSAFRPRPQLFFALPLLLGIAQACAAVSSDSGPEAAANGLSDSGPREVIVVDGGALHPKTEPGADLNPLCGTVGHCGDDVRGQPDDSRACADFMPQTGSGGTSGSGGVSGSGAGANGGGTGASFGDRDASRDAGMDASSARDGSSDGGTDRGRVDGSAPPSGFGAGGSVASGHPGLLDARAPYSPTPEVDAGALYSCQVVPADKGAPSHECVRAGGGDVGSPCAGAIFCRAGLACVGTQGAGQCQRYCCKESNCKPIARPDGGTTPTFCTEQPLLQGRETMLNVPVCVPVDECRLDEKADCAGEGCKKCPVGEACAVVNAEGQTSCIKPGSGRGGDTCPCAGGYYCSKATKLCIKYCQPGLTDALCSPGKCQAAAGLPEGFGLCVSSSPNVR